MITFINTFLSYVILVIASVAIVILAVFSGKKLRDYKDKKDAAKEDTAKGDN